MSKGLTCYERDEMLCTETDCLQEGKCQIVSTNEEWERQLQESDLPTKLRMCYVGKMVMDAADEIDRLQDYKRRQAEDIMTLGQEVGRLMTALEKIDAIAVKKKAGAAVEMQRIARMELSKCAGYALNFSIKETVR